MRESLDRSLDREATAYRLGELVDREKWLEPLLDQIAPFIRLQLGDLVAFLEITRKYVPVAVPTPDMKANCEIQFLLLARPPENSSYSVLFPLLPTRNFAYRYGILHENRLVHCDQCLFPLLADRKSIPTVSVSCQSVSMGILGHSFIS
jgi:hypothetical protein